MERFNDFCNRFNERIDPGLVVDSRKQGELRVKREALARDRSTTAGEAEKLAQHDAQDDAYAATFRPEMTFTLLQEFIGTAEVPGRLAELNGTLNAVPGSVIGADRVSLSAAFLRATQAAEALSTTERELQRRASQVSFRSLYGAVVQLEGEGADRCPACETPVDRTARNPFNKAREGLVELRELAMLQERQERARAELAIASTELRAELAKLSAYVVAQGEAATTVGRYLEALPARPEGVGWWMGVDLPEAVQDGGRASLEQLLSVADRIATADLATRGQLERRTALAAEREDLIVRQRHIDQRRQVRQRIVDDAAAARANIEAFEAANARLIEEAEQERLDILRDAPIRAAYDAYSYCVTRVALRLLCRSRGIARGGRSVCS
jgi:hypothetical protein